MDQVFDALVIGAGFSGLYALHKLRSAGLNTRVIELAEGVGGTWFWNRYPGARCDLESVEYSYSFSREIEQEWTWTESMPAQPEMEAYLNFVADRLDLRRDIQLKTCVTSMAFDDRTSAWLIQTDQGQRYRAQFVIAATGLLSVPLEPAIVGMNAFAGTSVFTSRFPRDGVDFDAKRVAIFALVQ